MLALFVVAAANILAVKGVHIFSPFHLARLFCQPACLVCLFVATTRVLCFVEVDFLQTNVPQQSTSHRYLWFITERGCD